MLVVSTVEAPAAEKGKFEVPDYRTASQILPPELVSGPHYKVREKVAFYGYMHSFTVDSDYGVFEVTGDLALRKLVKEIGAIASLQEVKKSQAYLSGMKTAVAQPIEFGANMITDPVDTITGVPKGVSTLFQNLKTGLNSPASKGEDRKVAQALAVSSSKRELASKLGVDVYSTNKVLQKELNGLAWATSLGSLSVSAALAPVGGPAAAAVTITRTAQQLNEIVDQYPPARLRQINEQRLQSMGIPSDLSTRFLDHQSYTPTQVTIIAGSLQTLSGAKGADAFLRYALSADDEESANFFQHIAEILKGYREKFSTVEEISVFGPLVFAKTSKNTAIVPLPIDYALWTERAAERVPDAVRSFKAMNPNVKNIEFWVTGNTSRIAKDELAKIGVQTKWNITSTIEFAY